MNYLAILITLWIVLIFIFAFVKIKISLYLYLAYLLLVPYLKIHLFGLTIGYNLVNLILLFTFLHQSLLGKKYPHNIKIISPFLFLFTFLILFALFGCDKMPLNMQLKYWLESFLGTCIIPFIFWNIYKIDKRIVIDYKVIIILSISIAIIYGLFLMQLNGINPYTSFLGKFFDISADAAANYSKEQSRIRFSTAGKIQATMGHPMTWALHLSFLMVMFFALLSVEKNKKYLVLLFFCAVSLLFSGVRTGIAALIIGSIYYLYRNRQIKTMFWSGILILLSYFVIMSDNDLTNLFTSFIDVDGTKSDVSGSSIQYRLAQLQGVVDEIKGSELTGNGYGWNVYFLSRYGNHPVIGCWESLFFVVLNNSGIIGMIIWSIFFVLLFSQNRKLVKIKNHITFMDFLIIVYFAYAMGTGEYEYIRTFAVYYTFMLCIFIEKENELGIIPKSVVNSHFISTPLLS